MKRRLIKSLQEWKMSTARMPLLVRGARQVGKTYLIQQFAKKSFSSHLAINFELMPQFKHCFEDLNPDTILRAINSLSKTQVKAGENLLFLDEIQECPQALMALRYFKELMPELHVIAAGSLLGFSLTDTNFSMPVGRVQSMYLQPLSFDEFLQATGHTALLEQVSNLSLNSSINKAIHLKLESLLSTYFVTGGMPAVVQQYINGENLDACQIIQASLLTTYRSDFAKYASTAQHKYLQTVLDRAPTMLGEHLTYSKVNPDMRSRDLKSAVQLLKDAGLIYQVYSTQASGLPLNSQLNYKKCKLLFIDIGLAKATSNLDPNLMLNDDLMLVNKGKLVEQFVGQELLTLLPNYRQRELFYWERNKPQASAEVDYVINHGNNIYPVEVKSAKSGSLKSLHYFLNNKPSKFGIRYSLNELSYREDLLSIPLYMISQTLRLIEETIT